MCFRIDPNDKTRPRNVKAYKVVQRLGQSKRFFKSELYRNIYMLGHNESLPDSAKVTRPAPFNSGQTEAFEGFYVYLTLGRARRALAGKGRIKGKRYALVECVVYPSDFIARGIEKNRQIASYRAVRLTKVLELSK